MWRESVCDWETGTSQGRRFRKCVLHRRCHQQGIAFPFLLKRRHHLPLPGYTPGGI
jgi:hypothetical protein